MSQNISHQKIMSFIKIVRYSFHDATIVYSFGGCYGFYQILKQVFPKATAYFRDKDEDHIVTKIGKNFYDINGLVDDDDLLKSKPLTKKQHEYWDSVASGQRLELILSKYERRCLRVKKDE